MELLRFIGFGGIAAFSAIGAFLVAGDERGEVRPGPALAELAGCLMITAGFALNGA